MKTLAEILANSARIFKDNIAVEDLKGRHLTYEQIHKSSDRLTELLLRNGVLPGDRIGIYVHKSIGSVVAVWGILKSGAAYVPVDPQSPPSRNAYILNDCSVKFVVMEDRFLQSIAQHLPGSPLTVTAQLGDHLVLVEGPGRHQEREALSGIEELAYILYTSGSTGLPKGVMYPHQGALGFIQWCAEVFPASENDVFSSHAPFHFDLSIFDLYVSAMQGSSLILIDEETGKQPMLLAELIARRGISVWYSTPSILTLLVKFGKLERFEYPKLRTVLFAGEVFPTKHLRSLKSIWKQPRYFNLYGPTETNVCTYFEIPAEIPPDRTEPFPIGVSCSHLTCKIFDEDGKPVGPNQEGELLVTGPIMKGYWNLPERTDSAFLKDESGRLWYKTGDIVRQQSDGNFVYVGRKDRMVKRRGYRVELGEIESAFYKHAAVSEAAVVATNDSEGSILIKAFLQVSEKDAASVIKMKMFAMENLPQYMIPDKIVFVSTLPKTSTDKIDYQSLAKL